MPVFLVNVGLATLALFLVDLATNWPSAAISPSFVVLGVAAAAAKALSVMAVTGLFFMARAGLVGHWFDAPPHHSSIFGAAYGAAITCIAFTNFGDNLGVW